MLKHPFLMNPCSHPALTINVIMHCRATMVCNSEYKLVKNAGNSLSVALDTLVRVTVTQKKSSNNCRMIDIKKTPVTMKCTVWSCPFIRKCLPSNLHSRLLVDNSISLTQAKLKINESDSMIHHTEYHVTIYFSSYSKTSTPLRIFGLFFILANSCHLFSSIHHKSSSSPLTVAVKTCTKPSCRAVFDQPISTSVMEKTFI
jgi:hypothetical protein